ncbi:hypothetical protein P4O66_005674 [Electrophorus voltai]|uniref:Transmembrane protein 218 n=1 Tax=Electrophorus voltai TaxID=2609070 RepID=A0AAD8ZJ84_9TELE|nr:hypothetical protein P4O66_005674 [Electrophorus voltai]
MLRLKRCIETCALASRMGSGRCVYRLGSASCSQERTASDGLFMLSYGDHCWGRGVQLMPSCAKPGASRGSARQRHMLFHFPQQRGKLALGQAGLPSPQAPTASDACCTPSFLSWDMNEGSPGSLPSTAHGPVCMNNVLPFYPALPCSEVRLGAGQHGRFGRGYGRVPYCDRMDCDFRTQPHSFSHRWSNKFFQMHKMSSPSRLGIIPIVFLALTVTLILVLFPRAPEAPSSVKETEIVDTFFIGRYVLLSVVSVVFLAALFMLLPLYLLEPVYAKPLRAK